MLRWVSRAQTTRVQVPPTFKNHAYPREDHCEEVARQVARWLPPSAAIMSASGDGAGHAEEDRLRHELRHARVVPERHQGHEGPTPASSASKFEVQDANLDVAKQVAAAEDFMAKGVDVLIITPVNEEGVVPLRAPAPRQRTSAAGAGRQSGEGHDHHGRDLRLRHRLSCRRRGRQIRQGETRRRRQGDECRPAAALGHRAALAGLHGRPEDRDPRCRRWSTTSTAAAIRTARSKSRPPRSPRTADINIIYGINDSSSLGGLQAWKAAGKSQDGLLVVGTGGEGLGLHQRDETPSRPTRSRPRCSRRRSASPPSTRR